MRSTIVIGYNRTLPSGRALLEAGREAALRGAHVTVVHAFNPSPKAHPQLRTEAAVREAAAETAAFGAGVLCHRYPGLTAHGEAIAGAPDEVLAAAARQADLLVLGVRDEAGDAEQHLGPVPELTLARTPCPTMVVRGPERYARGIVLAAIDVAEPVGEVVNFAFAEARFRSATLRAVSAVSSTSSTSSVETSGLRTLVGAAGPAPEPRAAAHADTQAELDRILAERHSRCEHVQVSGQVLDGPAPAVLTAAAAHADVVVTGARRRDGERHGVRIGAVTQALLRHTACPVIVVPHL